jgi:hypothetical protein
MKVKDLLLKALDKGAKYFTCPAFEGKALIADAVNLPYAWMSEEGTMLITGKRAKVARVKLSEFQFDILVYATMRDGFVEN